MKELGQKYYKNGEIKIKALSGAKYIWALQNLLSDYKRALKELEEYEEKDKQFELLRSSISIQEVKENLVKYQEEYELLLEHQSGKESNRTKYLRGRIHMCQELLEGRK